MSQLHAYRENPSVSHVVASVCTLPALVKGIRKLHILNIIIDLKTVSFLFASSFMPSSSSAFLDKAHTECIPNIFIFVVVNDLLYFWE